MALKELIFNSLAGCGGLMLEGCGGLERTDFYIYIIDF